MLHLLVKKDETCRTEGSAASVMEAPTEGAEVLAFFMFSRFHGGFRRSEIDPSKFLKLHLYSNFIIINRRISIPLDKSLYLR